MPNLGNVLKGLEHHVGLGTCEGCPYFEDCDVDGEIAKKLLEDTVELLKAQEPRTETQGRWERVGTDGIVCCSVCGMPMNKTCICFPNGDSGYCYIATKYCPNCGAKNEKGDCDG